MKPLLLAVSAMAAFTVGLTACSQTEAAPPAPTQALPTAAKAAEPTKAQAAAPTAAPKSNNNPAARATFPEKGKSITLIIPWTAGGTTDVGARLLVPLVEKELGASIQIVNRAGAGSQVGLTEMAKAKPDGYTLAYTNLPAVFPIYLDPERKAAFGRQDLMPVALHVIDPGAIGVKADSTYKTMKDLVDAAKAKPGELKASGTGLLGIGHLEILQVQRSTGTKFSMVNFDSGAQATTALLGGHTTAHFGCVGDFVQLVKNNEVRALGVMQKSENKLLPGVKTMESQGFPMFMSSARGISAPKGTPKDVLDTLEGAFKRAMDNQEHQAKMLEMGFGVQFMGQKEFAEYWDKDEALFKELMPLAAQQ